MANGENEKKKEQTTQPDPDTTKQAASPSNGQKETPKPSGDNGSGGDQPDPKARRQRLHSHLISLQSEGPLEGIPEDFSTFEGWMQDQDYRLKFHKFLRDQQAQGVLSGVPESFSEFDSKLTGAPDAAEKYGSMVTLDPSQFPDELSNVDLDLEDATDQAYESTAKMDELDTMEDFRRSEQRKAAQAVEQAAQPSEPFFTRSGGLRFAEGPQREQALQRNKEFQENMAMAEMRQKEAQEDLKAGNITETEYKKIVDNIWTGHPAQMTEEAAKGLTRGVVSMLPSMFSEFMGQFYYDPFDNPLNGPSDQTLKMREDWQKAADWFESLGQTDALKIHANLEGKTLNDVIENPAIMPAWLTAKAAETAPSMIPGIAAMKVLGPVSTAGQIMTAATGAAPIEIGAQLQELRKEGERTGEKVEEWQKALAVGSGMAAAAFEGVADRYIFKYVQDAFKGSGLSGAAKTKAMEEVGRSLANRFWMILKNSGKQSGIEAMTEATQQVLANSGAKYGWDPERGFFDHVPEATVIGGTVGGATTFTFSTAGEVIRQNRELESSMEGQVKPSEDLGPLAPVTFTVPTQGSIGEQLEALQTERQRIEAEKVQAEKQGKPTIDHDMALSRLAIIQSNVQKEIEQGRKEAIELNIQRTAQGPSPRQTQEADQRRQQALGQAETTEEGPARDASGQPILSPEEYQELSEQERSDYRRPIKKEIKSPSGSTTQIDAGLAPFASAATSMGYDVAGGDSGLQVDHPGAREAETGQVQSRGDRGNIIFSAPEAPGSANTPTKIGNVKQAARQAGLSATEQQAPERPGIKVSLPFTRDGSSRTDIYREANRIADQQNPELRAENFDLWERRRDMILEEQVLPEHGGIKEYTDQEVLNYWEEFTQQLEQAEGMAPDQRTSFEIDQQAAPGEQLTQIREQRRRIMRNRKVAETRGLDTEPFEKPLQQLEQRESEILNQRQAEFERRMLQDFTIEQAIGKRVQMGEYTGTLTQDTEGNIVVETDEGAIVEVPDTRKDTSLPLSQTDVVVEARQRRVMELTDPAQDRFQMSIEGGTGVTLPTEEFVFLSSNTNDAGEVVSVTMLAEDGTERTFRDPDVVEQVIWQQYFSGGVTPNISPDQQAQIEQAIDQQEQQVAQQDEGPEFTLDDGDPVIDRVLDKLDQGQRLTLDEQEHAELWVMEKMDQLEQSEPDNYLEMWQFLIKFQEDVRTNQPDTSQQPAEETTDEVPTTPEGQPQEGTGPTFLESQQISVALEDILGFMPENAEQRGKIRLTEERRAEFVQQGYQTIEDNANRTVLSRRGAGNYTFYIRAVKSQNSPDPVITDAYMRTDPIEMVDEAGQTTIDNIDSLVPIQLERSAFFPNEVDMYWPEGENRIARKTETIIDNENPDRILSDREAIEASSYSLPERMQVDPAEVSIEQFNNMVVGAVIQVPEPTLNYYVGRTHQEALQKAVDEGVITWDDAEAGRVNIDLFLQGDGSIIPREEAAELIGIRDPNHADLPTNVPEIVQALQNRGHSIDQRVLEALGQQPQPEQAPDPFAIAATLTQDDYIARRIDQMDWNPTEADIAHMVDNELIPEHKRAVAEALERGEEVPEKVLQDYPDLLADTAIDPEQRQDPQEIEAKRRLVKDMTREQFRTILFQEANITEEQLEAVMALVDKRAEVWAKQNGRNPSEYYRNRLHGIVRQLPSDESVVNEVVESYGDQANSIEDVGRILEDRMNYDSDDYQGVAESGNGPDAPFNSARQLGFFEDIAEDPDYDPVAPGLRAPDPARQEFVFQEREFYVNSNWNFTRPKSIQDHRDIAWMFSELENQAVEHIFLTGIDSQGEVHNIHISKGTPTSSLFDMNYVAGIVQSLDLQEITMVHNHPSGNPSPSRADQNIWRRIASVLPAGVKMRPGIIIDRDSGRFTVFTPSDTLVENIETIEEREQYMEAHPEDFTTSEVFNYDRLRNTIHKKPYGDPPQITSPHDVGQFVDSQRIRLSDKFSLVLLDNAKQVIGFVHLKNQPDLERDYAPAGPRSMLKSDMVQEVAAYLSRFGAQSGILVSNQNVHDFRRHKGFFGEMSKALESTGLKVDDVLSVAPSPSASSSFQSMKVDGVFEPISSYNAYSEDAVVGEAENQQSYRTGEQGIIELFENEDDFNNIIKSLGKIFRQDLTADDRSTLEAWLNVKDGNWTPDHDEKFSNMFVKYLSEPGKADVSSEVKGIFAKIKEWIAELYNTLLQNDQGVTISSDIRRAFDNLFTSPIEQLRNSEGALQQKGNQITVSFRADGSEDVEGQFAVVEARDLQASHNPDGSLNSRHVISKGQPRDRRGRKYIAQHKEIAQNLNPAAITGNGGPAFYNAPVTNARGEVIQGNGRSISIQIAYSENPGKAQNYKNYLIENAAEWGLDPNAIGNMQRPVLVRSLPVSDKEAVRLGNLKNTDEAKMDPLDEAKASVRSLSSEDRQKIGNLMEGSEAESIRAILDDVGPDIIDLLPGITRSEFMNQKNEMTIQGKDFLAQVFESLMFDSESGRDTIRKFEEMPHDIRRGIERSYGTLIKYLGTPADLSVTLQNAIDIIWNVRRNDNMDTASDFVNQGDVFSGGQDTYTAQEARLAQVLMDTRNPSSQLMKDLGISGTQKAIRTLIRDYANKIDGKTDLFTTDQPPGNTPEGAARAFRQAFERVQEPEKQPGRRSEPESGPDDTESSAGRPSSAGVAFTRASGIDNIVDLAPLGDVDVSWLAQENIQRKDAKKLAKKIKSDPEGKSVGMRSIVNLLNDALDIDMRVGKVNTSRRRPANQSRRSDIMRTRSPLDTGIFHEAGHSLHFDVQERRPMFLENFEWEELMDILEENNLSRASAENNKEYFAEFIRAYIMNPEFTSSLDLTAQLEATLQAEIPAKWEAVKDVARLYKLHRDRGTVAMTRSASKDLGPKPATLTEGVTNTLDRVKFTALGRNWAIDQFERDAVWKAFRAVYDSRQEANQHAREFLKSIRETPADFRLAHQVTNRIPGIVRDALHGAGIQIFTTGDGLQVTTEDIETLLEAGMEISEDLEQVLTDPNARHGQKINLTNESIEDILEDIGEDNWSDFEWYAQHKVSLERLIAKQAAYPGITDSSPKDVYRKVQDFEQAHPQWEDHFQRLNDYMDKLVLTSFIGGIIDVKEAATIVGSYQYYLPLPRQLENRISSLYRTGGTAEGKPQADPGFRYITGEGDHPFMPLLKAIEGRTYQAIDAYYQNRAMLAPIRMAEEMNRRDDLPRKAKIPVNQLVSQVKLDMKKVADLRPEEMAKVVADYLNEQNRQQAAAEMGEDPGSIMITDPITPDQINISTPSMPIWRATEPNGINIIAAKRNGQTVFYQLKNDFMYDYFARIYDPSGFTKWFDTIAEGTAPWKQIITKTLDFIGRNLPRDAMTNLLLADLPEHTVDDITTSEFIKSTIPGYHLVTGIMAKITGKTEGEIVDTELLSRTMFNSMSLERRSSRNRFMQALGEGIIVDNWKQMEWKKKAAHIGYVAPINILSKPFILAMEYLGLGKLSTMVEEGPRAGAYMDFRKRGYSQEAAAMAHDHASGNFGEKPANETVHAAYRAAGFINPATQIFSEITRRLTSPDSRIRWQQGARMGMIGLYTAMIWAISKMLTDPDREKELEERTDQERANYMPLFGAYRVPFDYGPTGAVQSFVWISLDNMAYESSLPADEFAGTVLQRMFETPIAVESPSGATSSIMQLMFGPHITGVVEGISNYKFYWEEPIVPPFLTQYPPEQQAFVTTPEFYKVIGEIGGYSPLKVQHVLNNATGYLMGRTLSFKDKIMSGEPIDWEDLPLGGKLVVRTPQGWYSQSAQRVSELNQEYLSLKRELKELQNTDTRDPEDIRGIRTLENQIDQLTHYHRAVLELESIYDRVKALRNEGNYEDAKALEREMTEIAASVLAQSGTIK